MTLEEKKEEAVIRMEMMNLAPSVRNDFLNHDKLNRSIGGLLDLLDDLQKGKVHKFELENDCLVYHVIHEYTSFGEMLACLYVSDYSDEWKQDRSDLKKGVPLAYVINLDSDICSEFGVIGIEITSRGSVIRIA